MELTAEMRQIIRAARDESARRRRILDAQVLAEVRQVKPRKERKVKRRAASGRKTMRHHGRPRSVCSRCGGPADGYDPKCVTCKNRRQKRMTRSKA